MNKQGRFTAACAAVVCALVFASGSAWATDYTWTGGAEGDGSNWCNPTNWGQTAEGAHPKTTSDYVTIPADTVAEITLPMDVTVYQMTLQKGCSFKLKGLSTEKGVPQLKLNSNFGDNGVVLFALDGVSFYRSSDWTPKAGCSFELTNGAELYLDSFTLSTMDSVSLSGGSTMSVKQLYFNGKARTLVLDDSTFEVRAGAYLGTTNPGGGHIVFKGRIRFSVCCRASAARTTTMRA